MSKLDISFNFPRDYALFSTKQQRQCHVVCEGQRKTETAYLRMKLYSPICECAQILITKSVIEYVFYQAIINYCVQMVLGLGPIPQFLHIMI